MPDALVVVGDAQLLRDLRGGVAQEGELIDHIRKFLLADLADSLARYAVSVCDALICFAAQPTRKDLFVPVLISGNVPPSFSCSM